MYVLHASCMLYIDNLLYPLVPLWSAQSSTYIQIRQGSFDHSDDQAGGQDENVVILYGSAGCTTDPLASRILGGTACKNIAQDVLCFRCRKWVFKEYFTYAGMKTAVSIGPTLAWKPVFTPA